MRKRTALVLGAAATAAALLLSAGGTYAYFAASAVSLPGEITAGDLTVEVDHRAPDSGSGPVGLSEAAPGRRWPASAEESYGLVITNTGSIPAGIDSIDLVVADGRAVPDLSEALEIRYSLTPAGHDPDWSRGSGWTGLASGPVLDLLPRRPTVLRPGRSGELHFQLRWPDGAPEYDNRFQGAGTEFVFNVGLGQA
ncbi:SipW-dependent-type signal peptide-containing protein [Actinorugispora endophytica]|uniref:Putative ribosomally synthesized peptide with SipW-like signal peptide n=1 Tax=Actinorugispora endophytica TaxID=1605990 RepID=A0A4R6UXP4_9ACTN|nr:SipW-dependent-type signal peptide-containing protein [Actinorugispora endophytica]TDQ52209.1 putative ribosomally synthesized peptide with SipW-like signal peptide [Actinorugispora endophytica]